MKIRAIAWDIDGTLIDSEPLHHACLVSVSRLYGVSLDARAQEVFLGHDMDWAWHKLRSGFPPELTFARWCGEIEDAYIERAFSLSAQPFVLEAMRVLRNSGVTQVCVSNSERRIVDANLAALGVRDYLAFSISRNDVAAGKPDPAPYVEACLRLGCAPLEVIAVEDSRIGLQSAETAGLRTVFMPSEDTDLGVRRHMVDGILEACGIPEAMSFRM